MALLETPRSLARDGGWVLLSAANSYNAHQLPHRYRNVAVDTGSAQPQFNLPLATLANGTPVLPLGHSVWVHNISASQSITVGPHELTGQPSYAVTSQTVGAGNSNRFVLVGYHTNRSGVWVQPEQNLTNGSGPAVPDGFRMDTVVYHHRNNFNCLAEAVAAGYDGTVPALLTILVPSNIVLGSDNRFAASFDTGGDTAIAGVNWFAGSLIVLRNEGWIQGYGGRGGHGGVGGTGAAPGGAGEDGGPALRAKIDVVCTNLGYIVGGCGGGGGGDGLTTTPGLSGGGGGGGCGARVLPSSTIVGGLGGDNGGTNTTNGTNGTHQIPGVGGVGSVVSGTRGGTGGVGGGLSPTTYTPNAGAQGGQLNDTGLSITGLGGLAGAAISRDAAATVTFTPGGAGIVGGATIVV